MGDASGQSLLDLQNAGDLASFGALTPPTVPGIVSTAGGQLESALLPSFPWWIWALVGAMGFLMVKEILR